MLIKLVASTRVPYTGSIDKTITFDTLDSAYIIRNIDGLGPVKADVSTIDTVIDPGGQFLSSRLGMRNIVLTIGFNPTVDSYAALRTSLFQVFMPEQKVELDFYNDTVQTYRITGYVESHDSMMFSSDPVAQISIICPHPNFTIPAEPVQSFSLPLTNGVFSVVNTGTVETGLVLNLDMKVARSDWLLQEYIEGTPDLQVGGYSMLIDDHLSFSTVKGDRYVTHTRGGGTTNFLGYFYGNLTSFKLYPGRNFFNGVYMTSVKNAVFTWRNEYGAL